MSTTLLGALPILPRISVRLTASQLLLAKPGLLRMLESIMRVRSGESPNPFMPTDAFMRKAMFIWDPNQKWTLEDSLRHSPVRPEDVVDNVFQEKNDPQIAEQIMQLWKQVWPVLHGRQRQRIHLDFLDLSICQLAVRALRKQVSHHHFEAPRPNHIQSAKRLLRLLEDFRKRARAAAVKAIGKEQYSTVARRWRSYACWLRAVSLSCNCGRKLPGYRSEPAIVDEVMKIAERELRSMEEYANEIPDKTTLRKWSREILRRARRGRINMGVRSLIQTDQGAACISIYMRERIWKQRKEKISRDNEKEEETKSNK